MLPPPAAPMEVARQLLADDGHTHRTGALLLRHWRGGWWHWQTTHWAEGEERAVRAGAYSITEHANYVEGEKIRPWAPTRRKVADLLEALAAVCHLADAIRQPSWIDGEERHADVTLACANGLLRLEDRRLIPHTPGYFNSTSVPFNYDPCAPDPERWLAFLRQLWPKDQDSIAALQEWLAYVISARTDLHKTLLLVGPTRGGKDVIARTIDHKCRVWLCGDDATGRRGGVRHRLFAQRPHTGIRSIGGALRPHAPFPTGGSNAAATAELRRATFAGRRSQSPHRPFVSRTRGDGATLEALKPRALTPPDGRAWPLADMTTARGRIALSEGSSDRGVRLLTYSKGARGSLAARSAWRLSGACARGGYAQISWERSA
jgi:hypothetical protein